MQNFSSCWRSEMIILRFSNAAHCQKVILGAAGSRYMTLQCGHVLLSSCCVSNFNYQLYLPKSAHPREVIISLAHSNT